MSSLVRRIQKKGSKIGVHEDVKPVKRAPRGSRRSTHKRPWCSPFRAAREAAEAAAERVADGR